MLLTQASDYGISGLAITVVFGGFAAFSIILRHNAPHSAFFYGQVGTGYRKVCLFRKFRGLQTRNRLTTIFAGVGHALKWNLKMTKALIAPAPRPLNHTVNREPRILDLEIAIALEFVRPRAIRQIIERNRQELEIYGSIATRRGDYKGKEFTEYFLNQQQAVLISMFSRTPKAAAVRKQINDVYADHLAGAGKMIPARDHVVEPTTMVAPRHTNSLIAFNETPITFRMMAEILASALSIQEDRKLSPLAALNWAVTALEKYNRVNLNVSNLIGGR